MQQLDLFSVRPFAEGLRVLEGEAFDDLVRRNPEVEVKTIRVLGYRLSTCEGRHSDLARKDVPARLAVLIPRFGEHEGVTTADGNRMIPTRYTHHQLASLVGSNREALTRALGRLRQVGVVAVLRRGVKHGPGRVDLFYGTPNPGNQKARELFEGPNLASPSSANRSRHVRTVSTETPIRCAM